LHATLYANLQGFCASLWWTRTVDPLLTMEAAVGSNVMPRRRLVARFPCNSPGFSA
jgi:hypothetical protein